jgi:hypothetical protein
MEVARVGLTVWRRGSVDEPLQEVRILVFDGLTKQPREAPTRLSVEQRKCKSGR